jgi:hypothetical protein
MQNDCIAYNGFSFIIMKTLPYEFDIQGHWIFIAMKTSNDQSKG